MTEQTTTKVKSIAIAGTIVISFSPILVRVADVSPSTAAIFRTLYALPLLAIGWLMFRRRDQRDRRHRLLGLLAGLALALDFAFWHRSIDYIGAGLATVLGNTQVFFVAIGAALFLGEKLRWPALTAMPIAFAGVFMIAGQGGGGAFGENPAFGVLFGILTGVTYALFLMLFRASNRGEKAPTVVALAEMTLFAFLGSMLIAPTDAAVSLVPHLPAHGWLVLLAWSAQVAGWLMIAYALPRLPSVVTSVLLLMQPVLSVLWGAILLGEALGPLQWAGAALVIIGIALMNLPMPKKAPAVSRPPGQRANSG